MRFLRLNGTILNIFLSGCFLSATASLSLGATQTAKRLRSNIDDSQTFVLKGNVRPVVAQALVQDQGEMPYSQALPRMAIHFAMTAAQHADLSQLLADQQNRRSSQFHKFLTPEQYAARFGLNTADVQKITLWLENNGFSNIEVARSRMWVNFSGTVGQAQAAFQTSIHRYNRNGEAHFANANDLLLPKALQGVAEGVRGLNDFYMRPPFRPLPHFTSSITNLNFLAPDDWATIYDVKPLYGQGLDGSGVSIAIVGQSDVQLSDLRAFRTAAGLPAKDPTVILASADPGTTSGDEGESDLDLEWSGGIAKNANILFYTSNAVETSTAYAINDNKAAVLSTSYGLCEADASATEVNTLTSLFAQANAQGMTIVAASGDEGAADCDSGTIATQGLAVDFPSSSPYVTGIGGTALSEGSGTYWNTTNNSSNGSAISYIPEVVWNDGTQSASGGGASTLSTKPTWQNATGVPNDGARDVPDLSFAASPNHDGFLICGHNTCVNGFRRADTTLDVTGGTSAGAPTFAGLVALLVQKTGARVGNVNPNLYSLAGNFANAFHDITSGSNIVTCTTGTKNCSTGTLGYSSGVGYDQASGLGSIDAYNLFQNWSSDYQVSATPNSLTVSRGSSSAATIAIHAQSNFTGTVSFTCSVASPLTNVTCSVPGTVSTSGSTTITITAGSTANTPAPQHFLPKVPPPSALMPWLLAALALATSIYLARKQRVSFAGGVAALSVLTLFAVSCGSGSSSGGSGGGPSTLTLSCSLPANAKVGSAYSGSCSAGGGTTPYSYSVSVGSLPAGLSINSSTGAITGTPTSVGTSAFTLKVTDSGSPAQTAAQAISSFVVSPAGETGIVTVTATSGALVDTAAITVTVQ